MTTVAAELRAAADKPRALATTATPGPWKTDTSIPYGHRVGSTDTAAWKVVEHHHGDNGPGLTLSFWCDTHLPDEHRPPPA